MENTDCKTNETCCKEATDCCTATDEMKAMKKALMADAVKNCMATVDPMALIAQLSLTVVQLQKDFANMEKAVGQHLSEIVNHFNTQMQRMAQPAPMAGAMSGAAIGKNPTQLKAVPPSINGGMTDAPAA